MSNTLVAYFSVSDKTEHIAEEIAQLTEADLFEIKPVNPYTKNDINWRDKNSRSSQEEANADARPEIADKVTNFDQFENIFIGFPIWWHTYPRIINTFLDSYNFEGKTVIPFATSGGSGIDKAEKNLKADLPSSKILDGKVFNNNPDISTIESWIKTLNI